MELANPLPTAQQPSSTLQALNYSYFYKPLRLSGEQEERMAEVPHLPKRDYIYMCSLGKGNFGEVIKAKAMHENFTEVGHVAIKLMIADTPSSLDLFINEAVVMAACHGHPNVLKLMGVCIDTTPYALVTEYMDLGDLRTYLVERGGGGGVGGATVLQLAEVCRQVASGMEHISGLGYVHCDLAARNCLVRSPLLVKIGDFGMAVRAMPPDDSRNQNFPGVGGLRPVRWMAPEALITGACTVQSDVWAFGVLIWEVFSHGAMPHCELTNKEVVEAVLSGRTLETPPDIPAEMECVRGQCMALHPSERPTFGATVEFIRNVINVCVSPSTVAVH